MSTIEIRNARARKPEWSMAEPVDFTLEEGEHIAIIGRNGSGKSMFVDMLTTYFLQQRWNQMEIDEETPTVGSKLEEAYQLAGDDTPQRRALQKHIYEIFHLESLLDKYIILLSSGELRKFKLAASLFTNPKVLIMENPFIGLDAQTRDQLKELLDMLTKEGLQIILVLAKTDEIPDFITHVVEVREMRVLRKRSFSRNVECGMWNENSSAADHSHQGNLIPHSTFHIPQEIIHFNKVTIRYGARTILKDLDWTVRQGEHWALSGDNGSGKSTLLSLVCADNPQAYACNISLFGHKRGSGESIWDIKRHIGYVSPEMHRSYKQNIPAIQIVASGLKDTIGLYVRPNEAEREQCRKWLEVFGIGYLADRKFMEMSSGEQRLVLLARAFVKEPDLLILDEPLHGLDDENRLMVKEIVDKYCEDSSRTLIYVTHYQEELPHCIDHSIFLKKNA